MEGDGGGGREDYHIHFYVRFHSLRFNLYASYLVSRDIVKRLLVYVVMYRYHRTLNPRERIEFASFATGFL